MSAATVDIVPTGTDIIVATPKDAGGATLTDRPVTWSTSDPAVATVASGVVTGVALGTATITATIEGHAATTTVRVREGAIVSSAGLSFTVQSSAVTIAVPSGALTQTKNITVAPAANPPANNRLMPGTAFEFGPNGITFASPVTITIKYDPSKLTAGSPESALQLYEGIVGTGWRVVPGSTANTTDHTVTGSVSHFTIYGVLMEPRVETIAINPDATVAVKTNVQFNATLKDNEQQVITRPVTWSSSNPSIVSINATTGLATPNLPGEATITATSEGKSATSKLTVTPGPAAKLSIVAGDAQSLAVGTAVPVLPAVKVTDAFDNVISGFTVTFAVASGGGTITGATATTNASGIATVGSWTLGPAAGPNTLTASGTGLTSVTFSAAAGAGAPTTVSLFAGNNQSATANASVSVPPSVKVTDANGNFIPNVAVVFTAPSGSGTVTGGSVVTNALGIATVGNWRLGPVPGTQTLIATAAGLAGSPITFTATAVAPVPARVILNSGNNQSAALGQPVAVAPTVQVVDAAGIPVFNFPVSFAVASGGGSVVEPDQTTDANGFAAPRRWILGLTVGTNTLTATAGTLAGSPVTFTATGFSVPPASAAIVAGNQQTAVAGTPVPVNPAVIVRDAAGNPVAGATVVFSIRSGANSSITGANAVTNSSGIATIGSWTLGIGGNSLFATVSGLSSAPLTFVGIGTVAVQVVTFGDSNTDLGYAGTDPTVRVSSYVSDAAPAVRLAPDAPNSPLQLAGKIENKWRAVSNLSIRAVNHGISGTGTGTGRNILGSPNAREAVNGVTRFEGEVLGAAYPWNGNEPVNDFFPNGGIARVQAFPPRPSDFLYISLGTNDANGSLSTATILNNLEWMIDGWVSRGLPVSHVMITTIPPRLPVDAGQVRVLNDGIRSLAQRKGVKLIDLVTFVSNDNGGNWADPRFHVDDFHYSEEVRDRLATEVVNYMRATP
jgi:adhesin/invasin